MYHSQDNIKLNLNFSCLQLLNLIYNLFLMQVPQNLNSSKKFPVNNFLCLKMPSKNFLYHKFYGLVIFLFMQVKIIFQYTIK